jgi:hypothetical protein
VFLQFCDFVILTQYVREVVFLQAELEEQVMLGSIITPGVASPVKHMMALAEPRMPEFLILFSRIGQG